MPDDPHSRITEQEESELMPRSAPRSNARDRDERALALLQGQVDALGHDIATARALAHRSPEGLGSPLRGHREADAPRLHGERVRLSDGGEIVIRAIEPRDVRDLRAGFERLSAVSRYRRFLTQIDHLTPHQLDYLTDVDHTDHEALVAVAVATGEGVGTARFVRDPGDGTTAEVAVAKGALSGSRTRSWDVCGCPAAPRAARPGGLHHLARRRLRCLRSSAARDRARPALLYAVPMWAGLATVFIMLPSPLSTISAPRLTRGVLVRARRETSGRCIAGTGD